MDDNFGKNVVVIKNKDEWIKVSKDKKHVFVMFFLNGCGPCINTKPLWSETANHYNYLKKNVLFCAVESTIIGDIFPNNNISGFPTLSYYHTGAFKENFAGDRSVEGFKKWIDPKINKTGGKSQKKRVIKKRRTKSAKKTHRGFWF